MKNRAGFTLIELLITLTILGIVLGIVMPSADIYSDYYQEQEFKTLARDLKTARTKAISEGKAYIFHMPKDGYEYHITRETKVIKKVKFKYLYVESWDEKYTFYSNGNVSEGGSLRIKDKDNVVYLLKVGVATGKISIVKE